MQDMAKNLSGMRLKIKTTIICLIKNNKSWNISLPPHHSLFSPSVEENSQAKYFHSFELISIDVNHDKKDKELAKYRTMIQR